MNLERAVRPRSSLSLSLSLIGALAVAGCGTSDPDRFDAVPASGTVTYKGKPLERGFVQFVPGRGRAASGPIGPGGKFTLTTYDSEGDGAVPGTHKVGVIVTEEVPPKRPGGEPEVRYIVPRKFADPSSSEVTVVVPPEGQADIAVTID